MNKTTALSKTCKATYVLTYINQKVAIFSTEVNCNFKVNISKTKPETAAGQHLFKTTDMKQIEQGIEKQSKYGIPQSFCKYSLTKQHIRDSKEKFPVLMLSNYNT